MASNWPNNPDKVLNSLFGNLVAGAEAGGRSTVNMWQSLRDAATNWATGFLYNTRVVPPTQAEIQAHAQQLIGHVTIQDMNRYSKYVGEFLRAKENLHNLGPDQQITAEAVFNAPWSTTGDNPAIPTRYRIRVQRDITVRGFTRINRIEWATYEITSPLTSIADALQQANTLFSQADYNSRAEINQVLDYNIEVV